MIKKCTNDTWTEVGYKRYETSTDTITSLPTELISDSISAYTIKGNMVQSQECGERTGNLFDGTLIGGTFKDNEFNIATSSSTTVFKSIKIFLSAGTYTFSWGKNVNVIRLVIDDVYSQIGGQSNIASYTITSTTDNYVGISFRDTTSSSTDWDMSTPIMLNLGSTALPYEPYGYDIPISLGQNTYNIYISKPLRKSIDGSNVYDDISSNGTLTRRVDENGDALSTPTTEQITTPTINATGTPETFNVLTTIKPSEVDLTYTGWHSKSDKKYESSQWN